MCKLLFLCRRLSDKGKNILLCDLCASAVNIINKSDDSRGVAGDDGVRRDIFSYHAAGTNDRIFTHGDAGQQGCAGSDRRAFFNKCGDTGPIVIGLQFTACGCCPRIKVVDEGDIVTDKNVMFDGDTFADEGVAGNFTVFTDLCAFLNFNEGAYLRIIADFTAVEVDEVEDFDAFTEFYILCDLFHFF
jgi:hypothetical protein